MKKYVHVFSLIIMATLPWLNFGCSQGGSPLDSKTTSAIPPSAIDTLWRNIITPYLSDDLWLSINNYDAAHVLMLPMHWAFTEVAGDYREEFDRYFERYSRDGSLAGETNNLRKLQYLYLHSQYLSLVVKSGQLFTDWQRSLMKDLQREVEYQWLRYPAWNYGGLIYPGGMKERLQDKMSSRVFVPEYSRAIFDEEFFLMAIAADLLAILKQDASPTLLDIQNMTYALFVRESVFVGEGWLFQPGVWSHHPDYQYAGNPEVLPSLSVSIIDDIATDSSHFHRMPLWLRSFRSSYEAARPEREFYDELFTRTLRQLEDVILVAPSEDFSGPRLSNFTDGRNGVYRYNYSTVDVGSGYGPYELSAVVLPLGWYVFLESEALVSAYRAIRFPLNQREIDLYVGPNTSRERHPLVQWPHYFTNGFAELHVLLALDD